MNRLRLLAGALAGASLAGCIVLPPPPMPYRPPPPQFVPRMQAPGWQACEAPRPGPGNDCARGADAPPEGARR
ncbi:MULTISPECIES: hypothetical protein [Variovorax]|jgi:hypothetical protein|uniref:hypothetical protein n=1 Tax=Variovorax TaxID=34072 RepID=UPI001ACE5011|nr:MULTISPECIES: hypothetical protein [Variovorax]MBN8756560.1 hypothetical protein [Variovorax sp.]UKI06528.1 hypothetical protein L3V85_27470 [Variovorax paradoxus]